MQVDSKLKADASKTCKTNTKVIPMYNVRSVTEGIIFYFWVEYPKEFTQKWIICAKNVFLYTVKHFKRFQLIIIY